MRSCEARMQKATPFENEVFNMLAQDERFVRLAVNGSEHTHDPSFMSSIRGNDSAGAILLRFAPDGVGLTRKGNIYYWDAKASDRIEKTAYEVYMAYHAWGCNVILFCRPPGHNVIRWAKVESLDKLFIDSEEHVKEHKDRAFPVIDGWIYPRRAEHYEKNRVYSGTPYRVIDVNRMNVWQKKAA